MADPPHRTANPTVSWAVSDVPEAWAPLEVPVVDAGNYRIVREVARGGVGRILEAVDTRLQREVALKQLLRPGVEEARFIREAVLTARLQHPSIVPIHEVGVFADGAPFIAMKLVRGESLRAAIRSRSRLTDRLELVSSVLLVAEAVACAHSQRVIHRDLKPSNVLLGSFGEVVVIDWGLAKHLDAADEHGRGPIVAATPDSTALGKIIGTPAYMPPEQARGDAVDERADVYALGAMLYEVLTGSAPIEGDTVDEVLSNLLSRGPAQLQSVAPSVPPELAVIVTKAMMPRAADRYREAGELAAELRRFVLGQPLSTRAQPDDDPEIERAFAIELGRKTAAALGVYCVLTVILGGGFAAIARMIFGRFDLRDVIPRASAMILLSLIFVATRSDWGRRRSGALYMAVVSIASVAMIIGNIVERDAMGGFTASMTLVLLGSATFIPLRPRPALVLLGTITVAATVAALGWGLRPTEPRFIVHASLLVSSTVLAVLGSHLNHALRRAEFYNRQRLQSANQRLARLERR